MQTFPDRGYELHGDVFIRKSSRFEVDLCHLAYKVVIVWGKIGLVCTEFAGLITGESPT